MTIEAIQGQLATADEIHSQKIQPTLHAVESGARHVIHACHPDAGPVLEASTAIRALFAHLGELIANTGIESVDQEGERAARMYDDLGSDNETLTHAFMHSETVSVKGRDVASSLDALAQNIKDAEDSVLALLKERLNGIAGSAYAPLSDAVSANRYSEYAVTVSATYANRLTGGAA